PSYQASCVVVTPGSRLIKTLARGQFYIPSIDVIEEPAGFTIFKAAIAVSRQRVGEEQSFLSTGDRHIKQPALLFEVCAAAEHHLRREEIFFQSHDVNVAEFKPFGHMDGHQRDLVRVFILVFILPGNQRYLLQESAE